MKDLEYIKEQVSDLENFMILVEETNFELNKTLQIIEGFDRIIEQNEININNLK